MPKSGFKLGDVAVANIEANPSITQKMLIGSKWTTECYDKDGNLKWVEKDRPNVVTDEGINLMLDVMFHDATKISTWYVAIFDNDVTPLVTWTYDLLFDTQAGECEEYDEATRPAYNEAAASAKSITNSANKATFTINATKTVYGTALVSSSTKGDHTNTGYAFCVSKFTAGRSVVDDDVLRVTITISGADS